MAIQDNNTLWNKSGSLAQITDSENGADGVLTGVPTYEAAKFDNGILTDTAKYVTFTPGLPLSAAAQMIIEFWWKPKFASTAASAYYTLFGSNASNDYFLCNQHSAGTTFQSGIWVAGAEKVLYRYNFAYAANTLYHVLIAFDGTLGATNRLKVYLDAVHKVPIVYAADLAFTIPRTRWLTLSDPNLNVRPSNAVIDNLKVYDSTANLAEILANRNNEGWPVTGGKKLIDGFGSPLLAGAMM